ncbi:MAG TPA: (d)CMP kinase [Gammaproteobacteria bacterium]|nr:(d)CMP kinase [Gammaproteobacteria bacterium]
MDNHALCVCIDGMGGTGKSTIAGELALKLQWNYLPSGCLYRWYAWQQEQGSGVLNPKKDAKNLKFSYTRENGLTVDYKNDDITSVLMDPKVAKKASELAKNNGVRDSLLSIQRDCLRAPGLVAEGRDMASVVFKNATLKVYLTASLEVRAKRRHKQLIDNGISATIPSIMSELKARDGQDMNRAAAPLVQVEDAYVVSTDQLSIDDIIHLLVQKVM